MNRVSTAVPKKKRHRRVLAKAKGMMGRRKSCYSLAVRAVKEAKERSYRGRKLRKRVMRQSWNKLISLLAMKMGTNYSSLIGDLLSKYQNRKEIYQAIKSGQLSS